MSKYFAGIRPSEAGYGKVEIKPQYSMSDKLKCTVPSVKGLITLDYEKVSNIYSVDLSLPQRIKTVVYIPKGADVTVNSDLIYSNGEYVNNIAASDIEIIVL
jgi:hypothetical protein